MGHTVRAAMGLVFWVGLCFAVAWFGARYAPGPDYGQLVKPAWTPPPWLFAPVWTVLYLMMALAAWLVWLPAGLAGAPRALGLFLVQLALNGLWSWLFFGLQRRGIAFVDVVLLWFAILATAAAFWSRRPLAGVLLVPYLAWVGFAGALNLAIWRLNV
ncbi:MAG TPA: TspO/MBR family protein [Gammaproteobacteria bacterium]|nr:TspO/MBR family protein [Gammaproteobacteria bacterium]